MSYFANTAEQQRVCAAASGWAGYAHRGAEASLDRPFSCVYLPSMLAVYYEQNKDGAIAAFGFIDCRGDGHFLNRVLPDGMQDTAPQIPDPYTLVLPVKDNAGNEGLCVYQYFAP